MMRLPARWIGVWIAIWIAGCSTLPMDLDRDKPVSHTLVGDGASEMGKVILERRQLHGMEKSGAYLLDDGLSAFLARVAVVTAARFSIDMQYYIFHGDNSGRVLASKMLEAAGRGVRIRLLVDDLGTQISDPWVAIMNTHPNIEIRVFNPVSSRKGVSRSYQQARHFSHINHRMHNKLIVVDGEVIISGGRNIGNEYFSISDVDFQDVDLICVGSVVAEAANSFDRYWNHQLAVPLDWIFEEVQADTRLQDLEQYAQTLLQEEAHSYYAEAVRNSSFGSDLVGGFIPMKWGKVRFYADDPEKALNNSAYPVEKRLSWQLRPELETAQNRMLISSAYFIPGDEGVDFLSQQVARGLEVNVLTNALSTTDVAAVHSGYSGYRKPLLEQGVKLWELRSQAGQKQRLNWFKGESKASLHAKTFVLDDDRVIVGSLNLDGRSIIQNTELALVVENPEINQQLADTFTRWTAPQYAWHLTLDDDKSLHWSAVDANGAKVETDHDPETTGWQRFKVWLLSLLPIESQL